MAAACMKVLSSKELFLLFNLEGATQGNLVTFIPNLKVV
jgi:hypothetical protein